MHHLLYTVTNSGKQDRNEAYWNILIPQNHLRILLFGTYFRLWSLSHKNTNLSFSLTLKKYNLIKLWYFKHQKQPTFPRVYSKQGFLFLSSETGARSVTPFQIKSGHNQWNGDKGFNSDLLNSLCGIYSHMQPIRSCVRFYFVTQLMFQIQCWSRCLACLFAEVC